MTNWTLRPATALDEPFLREMLWEALFVPPGAGPFGRAVLDEPDIAHYVTGFGRAGDVGLIAVDPPGHSIGAAWVRRLTNDDPGYGYVDDDTAELSIAVVAGFRGQGLGTELMRNLLAIVPRCSLSCDERNPALGLYSRCGFYVVGRSGRSVTMLRDRRDR